MEEELNYEQDVSIDEDSLDTEWLEQPRLMLKYSRFLSQTRAELEKAKERMEITKAELDKEVRTDPESYGLAKITEGAVQSAITTSERFQKAQEKYREAQYNVNMAQSAVKAVDGKKDALENLVRLYGQQYFAGPQVPRDLSKEWEEKQRQKQGNTKVNRTMKRKNNEE